MKLKNILLLSGAIAIGALSSNTANAQKLLTEDDVKQIVQDYIGNNPEVILDSLEQFRIDQNKASADQAREAIKENLVKLTSSDTPMIGNKNGDIAVIEFFDYNCGYCKRALPDLVELVENDKNVAVYFKEMPILGPPSILAAKWAMAAKKQGKYFEYHQKLMESRAEKNEATLMRIATDLKLDVDQMQKDANSDEIDKMIEESVDLARKVGVRGTPAFIIGDEFRPGYLGVDGLNDAVAQARKK